MRLWSTGSPYFCVIRCDWPPSFTNSRGRVRSPKFSPLVYAVNSSRAISWPGTDACKNGRRYACTCR
jgi:hypothetical protein